MKLISITSLPETTELNGTEVLLGDQNDLTRGIPLSQIIAAVSVSASDVPIATTTIAGRVKPDGNTVSVTGDGTLSVNTYNLVPKTTTINSKPLSGNISLSATDIGLGNVANVNTTNPANISQSTTYRFVSDTEKTTWNSKQNALGFTPVSNTTTINNKPLSGNISLNASDVGLGNVVNLDTTNPANITQSANYRFVSDSEKTTWNNKQSALGFIPVPNTTTINNHPLSGNVTLAASDVGLGNVQNVDTTNAANITSGTLSASRLPVASTTSLGVVKVDGSTITINNGVISSIVSSGGVIDTSSFVNKSLTINSHPLSGNISLNASDIGLGNVSNVDATNPTNITQSANYRFVSDSEKTTWNNKQNALGFTPVPNTITINSKALSGSITLNANDIGLGDVTNDAQVKRSEMGVANGVATLGSDSKITTTQLPVFNLYKPATYVIALQGSGYSADYYAGSDAATAIQAAVTAILNSGKGGKILCMEGTYNFSTTVTLPDADSITIEGMSPMGMWSYGGTIFVRAQNIPMFNFTAVTKSPRACTLKNIQFKDSITGYTTPVVRYENSHNMTQEFCYFNNVSQAILAYGAWDFWTSFCNFRSCGTGTTLLTSCIGIANCVISTGGRVIGQNGSGWKIIGCRLETRPGTQIYLEPSVSYPMNNFSVTDTKFEGVANSYATYNGHTYRCILSYSASANPTPNIDTTHWVLDDSVVAGTFSTYSANTYYFGVREARPAIAGQVYQGRITSCGFYAGDLGHNIIDLAVGASSIIGCSFSAHNEPAINLKGDGYSVIMGNTFEWPFAGISGKTHIVITNGTANVVRSNARVGNDPIQLLLDNGINTQTDTLVAASTSSVTWETF